MSWQRLYEDTAVLAFLGGLLMGILGFCYQLSNKRSSDVSEPSIYQRGKFKDAWIVACVLLVPETALFSLPLLRMYGLVEDERTLNLAAVFLASMYASMWVWLLTKIGKTDVRRAYYSFFNLLIFSGPALLPFVLVILIRLLRL